MVGALPEAARLVAVTTSASDALTLVARHRPDLLLLSDVLQQGCGVDLACDVKRLHPATRVLLVLTRPGERGRVAAAIAAGCEAVLRDGALGVGGELMAIRTVCRGGMVIDRELEAQCRRLRDGAGLLSPRECQVLQRVVHGDNNLQIAERLFLSVDTVKSHVSRAVRRCGDSNWACWSGPRPWNTASFRPVVHRFGPPWPGATGWIPWHGGC